MMRSNGERNITKVPIDTQQATQEISLSPEILWRSFIYFAGYRIELFVKEVMVFPNGEAYYVCPKCNITLEREFMAYCDRCGQRLGWKDYKKAKVIRPGRRK